MFPLMSLNHSILIALCYLYAFILLLCLINVVDSSLLLVMNFQSFSYLCVLGLL